MCEEIKHIKQDLRAMMNGVASAAMRSSADYRVNFGVELPRLCEMADAIRQDKDAVALHPLAQQLWKENVRECRILALMLQPSETYDEELCDIWVAQIHTPELAQIASLYLFRRLPFALSKSFEWIATDIPSSSNEQPVFPICGYATLFHLHRLSPLDDRSLQEIADQISATQTDSLFLSKLIFQWTNILRPNKY